MGGAGDGGFVLQVFFQLSDARCHGVVIHIPACDFAGIKSDVRVVDFQFQLLHPRLGGTQFLFQSSDDRDVGGFLPKPRLEGLDFWLAGVPRTAPAQVSGLVL